MPDWDKDSPQLQKNLKQAVETARNHARAREESSLDQSRRWHTEIMRGLQVSPDARRSWVGHFRGETGQAMVRIHVGGHEGTAPSRVADELSSFEKGLKAAVNHLDKKIPPGTLPDVESLDLILLLMSWLHGEWVRIHPFANGNGRIARLWANWVAMRYGVPPFVRLRPRPEGMVYVAAAAQAMEGNYEAMLAVFRGMLQQFLDESQN